MPAYVAHVSPSVLMREPPFTIQDSTANEMTRGVRFILGSEVLRAFCQEHVMFLSDINAEMHQIVTRSIAAPPSGLVRHERQPKALKR